MYEQVHDIFIESCKYNDLKKILHLFDLYNIDIHYLQDDGFRIACKNGCLKVVDYLFNILKNEIDSDLCYYFMIACEAGNIKTVKHLIESLKDINPTNLDEIYKWGLSGTCLSGAKDVAQYLLENFNIDVHADNDLCFISACQNDNIELVKYFVETYGNFKLDDYNNFTFKYVCKNGYLELAEYLCSIYDKYSIKIVNGHIKYTIK